MENRVIGNYKVVERIGLGGMGAVYRAVDLMLEREVAIKALRSELGRDREASERFRAEAVILAKLNHPNIATVYGLVRERDDLFLVMEFVHGETLDERLARSGPIAWPLVIAMARQVLDALDHAHRAGVVHRDVKPANLMLTPDGTIKITDFGIARFLGADRRTRVGHSVGTVAYMSPEQVRGEDVDGRSDLYALGAVLHELLTGRLPFDETTEYAMMMAHLNRTPPSARTLNPAVPGWLDAALVRALAKAPADRFQTAAAFAAFLDEQAAAAGQSPVRRTPTPPPAIEVAASVLAGDAAAPPKETRLASTPPPAVAVSPDLATETRLAGAPGAPAPVAAAHGPTPAGRTPWIPVRPLNWRHAVSAAALVVVLGTPLAMYLARQRSTDGTAAVPAPAVPTTTTAPAPPAPTQEAPAAFASPPATMVVPPPVQQPAPPVRVPAIKVPATLPPPGASRPAPVPAQPAPAAPPVAPENTRPEPPAPAEPPVSYEDATLMRRVGGDTEEVSVILRLRSDALQLVDADTGETVRTVLYSTISGATYSVSRQPRMREGVSGKVVGVLSMPFRLLRGTKHWLTVETGGDAVVLQLDGSNADTIVRSLETRSGVKIDRVTGDK